MDQAKSLRERVETEGKLYSEAMDKYQTELNEKNDAIRNNVTDAKQTKRDEDNELKFNRQYGAQRVDDLSRDESNLLGLSKALQDPKRAAKLDTEGLAEQLGVTPEQKQQAFELAKKDELFGDPSEEDVAKQMPTVLLSALNQKLAVIRKAKADADKMMRTGQSLEQVQAESGGGATEKKPTSEQVRRYIEMYPTVNEAQATQILTDRLNGR
jgi:hypothetical protein